MSPMLSVFGRQIPIYGILYYLAIAVAAIVCVMICKRRNIQRYDIVYSAVFIMIGAMLGSKLLFLLVSMPEIIRLQLSWIAVIKGGFVFYGGLIGGALGLLIYLKQFRLPAADFFDTYAVVLPLGHAIGRVGCFSAGCCYGIAYSGIGAHTYHAASDMNTPLNTPLLPIQLIEAALLVILFFCELFCYYRYREKKWLSMRIYLIAYATMRFCLEFFRGDRERGIYLGLSTSQWVSLALLILGFLFPVILHLARRRRKNAPTA